MPSLKIFLGTVVFFRYESQIVIAFQQIKAKITRFIFFVRVWELFKIWTRVLKHPVSRMNLKALR